jgi:hypothetical protein
MADTDTSIVDDESLPAIIEGEVANAIGHWDGLLAAERKIELDYYNGRPFGNEVEGESQVVSTDVADTIEGILPSILRIFTASDDAVRFDANGPEDEKVAQQMSDVCNYVFYRQNNGFLVLYEWFKDALIQKNGIVKYWWEDKQTVSRETYHGLTEGQYLMMKQQPEMEIVEENAYDDPAAAQQKQFLTDQITQTIPAKMRGQALAQLNAQKLPQLYDCTLKITKDASKCCIQAIPPEEFGISAKHNCVSIQDAPFCYHRSKQTISQLREAGCPEEVIADIAQDSEADTSPESMARDRFLVDQTQRDNRATDPSMRDIWVTECFIRIDYDHDGVAELRHIIMPGRTIWINEETEHINFAAITPVIMPHRWVGRSVSELVADIQFTKSVIWRQMLNNLYLTNNPRKAVLSSAGGIVQANLDDLLTSRPGGIVREYSPNAVRDLETPFVANASFPMLEYMDGIKENRTGVTRYNQGTDANSLNKTARGINAIMSAGQQRIDLIARIFAETGVKDLFRGIAYMLSKYSSKAMTVKLRNSWVDVDPREWKTQFNTIINVGLGTGNRDVQLQHLSALHESQIALMKEGRGYMVTDENLFNLYTKMSEAMGFKHPELFVTDPRQIPPQAKQQPPDPAAMKVQADAQEGQAKLQFGAQKEQLNAQTLTQLEQIKANALLRANAADNQTKKEIAAMQLQHQAQIEVFKQHAGLNTDFEKWKAELDNATKVLVAQISAKAALDTTAMQAEAAADKVVARTEAPLKEQISNQSQQVVDQIGGISKILDNLSKLHATQIQIHQEAKKNAGAPKKLSLENIQVGKDGIISGATVKSS